MVDQGCAETERRWEAGFTASKKEDHDLCSDLARTHDHQPETRDARNPVHHLACRKGGRPITIVIYVKAKSQEVGQPPHKDKIIAQAVKSLVDGQEVVIDGKAYALSVEGWRVGK